MRRDGLFPVRLNDAEGAGLVDGSWPPEIRETLTLVTGEEEQKVLASRRLTIRVGAGLTNARIQKLCRAAELDFIRRSGDRGASFSVRIPGNEDPVEYARKVRAALGDSVERVMPEFLRRHRPAWRPAGPLYEKQWQWYEPTADALAAGALAAKPINIEAAWEATKGEGVRIAVIDTSFDVDHPDLTDAILETSGHFPSAELAEFQQGRTKVRTGDSTHGTFCAGMAAAHEVEGRGIVGAAPEASLVLLSLDSWTSLEILGRALEYVRGTSVDSPLGCMGSILSWFLPITQTEDSCEADVVCMSSDPILNAEGYLEVVAALDALGKVHEETGIPVFAPAGNDKTTDISKDEVLLHPQVLVISLVGEDGTWIYSSYGDCIDFAAPGYHVVSTYPQWSEYGDDIGTLSGTSFAAPCAGGVAALLLSVRPSLSTSTIREILKDTCDEVPCMALPAEVSSDETMARVVGAGRINAGRALYSALEEY